MSSQIAKLREGIERYPRVELQVAQSQKQTDPAAIEDRVYAELAKQLGVDAKLLREKLPQLAAELKGSEKDNIVRAAACYMAKDYPAAERLALEAAAEARTAAKPSGTPDLSKPSGGGGKPGAGASYHPNDPNAADALRVAALSAAKGGQPAAALNHFREAAKYTDRKADPEGWQDLQTAISAVSIDLENAKKLKYEDSVSDLKE